jgi:hypothetical protein
MKISRNEALGLTAIGTIAYLAYNLLKSKQELKTKEKQYTTDLQNAVEEVKKEVKASVSGIYVTEVKGLHGKVQAPEQKKGFFKNLVAKAQEKAGAKMVK